MTSSAAAIATPIQPGNIQAKILKGNKGQSSVSNWGRQLHSTSDPVDDILWPYPTSRWYFIDSYTICVIIEHCTQAVTWFSLL